jgi:hypothetical protein
MSTAAEKQYIISTIVQAKGNLRQELCSVTAIFIMKDLASPARSSGFWEDPLIHLTSPNNNTYIFLNSDDLNRSFSDRQNKNRDDLGITVGKAIEPNTLPGDTVPQTWGLLYALAHEWGHIKWHQLISNPPCKNSISGSWTSITKDQKPFTAFGMNFGVRDVASIPLPNNANTQDALDKIYYGGFATPLSAANPEEDFVESYSVRAVANACGNSCGFQYQIATGDTVTLTDVRGNPNLRAKFNCANGMNGPPAPIIRKRR